MPQGDQNLALGAADNLLLQHGVKVPAAMESFTHATRLTKKIIGCPCKFDSSRRRTAKGFSIRITKHAEDGCACCREGGCLCDVPYHTTCMPCESMHLCTPFPNAPVTCGASGLQA